MTIAHLTKNWLGTVASFFALISLAACGSDATAEGNGAWTYTDDLGTEISLDAPPENIVAQSSMAAALNDLGVSVVGAFGPLRLSDGSVDPQAAGLDVDSLTDVTGGGDYGDLDLEKLATLEPDLVVTSSYVEPDLWYVNAGVAEKLSSLAPVLAVTFDGQTLPQLLDGTERAAKALGADLNDESIRQAHQDFDEAADRLRAVGEQLGDRRILAGSAATDVFYVSNPDVSPDLAYYRDELGLPIVTPENPDEGGYFESLSWENADRYEADIFMWDERIGEAGLALVDDQPAFQSLQMAKDEAYVPWTSVAPPSRKALAADMNELADQLEENL